MDSNNKSVLDEQKIAEKYPDIYKSLIPLLRAHPEELNAYLETVCCNVGIDDTRTQAHCYFVALYGMA